MPLSPANVSDERYALLGALAGELSDVRRRGIDAVDRDDTKQKRLNLPHLESIISASPWSADARPSAVRKLVVRGMDYVRDFRLRGAAKVLYGFGGPSDVGREEAELRALGLVRSASDETRKRHIRDVRYALARGILAAASAGFEPPSEGLVAPPGEERLPERTRAVLAELRELRHGNGATPDAVRQTANALLGLPGVQDQAGPGATLSAKADAVIDFLRCAVATPRMSTDLVGRLVGQILNLNWSRTVYEQRREAFAQEHCAGELELFDQNERTAFIRLSVYISGLGKSPCRDESRERALDTARHLFALIMAIAEEQRSDVAQHLLELLHEEMPSLGSQPSGDWLSKQILTVHDQFNEWAAQYRDRVAAEETFVPLPALARYLRERLSHDRTTRRFAQRNFESSLEPRTEGESEAGRSRRVAAMLAATLALLAQVFAYNETHDDWLLAPSVFGPKPDVPLFPIASVANSPSAKGL